MVDDSPEVAHQQVESFLNKYLRSVKGYSYQLEEPIYFKHSVIRFSLELLSAGQDRTR